MQISHNNNDLVHNKALINIVVLVITITVKGLSDFRICRPRRTGELSSSSIRELDNVATSLEQQITEYAS